MAKGDAEAFDALYDRHASVVFPLLLRIVRTSADAEEVLQETWLQAWRSAASYDAGRGTVLAWLLNMARSRALDRYRAVSSRRRAETRAEAEPVAASIDPVDLSLGAERARRVRDALTKLKPRQREVLEIAYFEGLSQTEIATRLGVPLGTVKTWMRQGTLALRELIGGESDDS
ncbi:MAG: sigma-70 family RNA polymerase sigma factor [Deltaproteobacteria bacterium]|nr:sigma-70 family RNA polymerase sigma factor [Deltaproteobacteria bacterium]